MINKIIPIAIALAISSVSHAADYVMTANDAGNTSSFNQANSWTSGTAPTAGNTYTTAGFLMRSPADGSGYLAGDFTFAGDSLTLGNGSGAGTFSPAAPNNNCFIFKLGSQTLTVSNLYVNGQQIRDGLGDGQWAALNGNLTVMSNGCAFMAQDTNIINSTLMGTGTIYIGDNGNGSAARVIEFTSGSSTFTGNIVMTNTHSSANYSRLYLTPSSVMNFNIGTNGVNNGISGQGTLDLAGSFIFNLSGADTNAGSTWDIVDPSVTVTNEDTFNVQGFTQSGAVWSGTANGVTYQFNQTNGQLTVALMSIVISQQPSDQLVGVGIPSSLSVTAAGPPASPLFYQWYFTTATSTNGILNATNATYSVPASSVAGVTNYFVIITNTIGNSTTSSVASVTVRQPSNLEWAGTGSGWDTTSLNWTVNGGSSDTTYTQTDNVTFDDLGSAQPTVNLSQSLYPSLVTVSGSASYTLSGSGSLIGYGKVIMNGSGTLLMDNTNNTYAGGTIVNSGTLQIGDGTISGSLGSGPVTNNSAIVAMPGATNETISSSIFGTGTLSLSSAGDLVLSASNSFTGGVTVNSGRLLMQDPNALGTGAASVASGSQLYLLGGSGVISPSGMTLNGSGPNSDGTGALRKGNASTNTFGGTVTLAGDTTLNVDGSGAALNLTNAAGINGSGANASLTLAGSGAGNISGPLSLGSGNVTVSGGTWTIAPTNSYSGLTAINAGALLLTGPLSLGEPPASFNSSQVTLGGGSLGAAADVTLADGKIGIDVNDASPASGIMVSSNATFVISNDISGDASSYLTKTGPGTLVLEGANDFAGQLNLDSGSTSANDGMTVIANNAAIANIVAIQSIPYITIHNNNGGSSTLGLDGSNGSITVAPDISLAGRNATVPAIENLHGDNTISGSLTLAVGGSYYIQSDSGTLTFSAPLPYQTPSGARTFIFSGDGVIDLSGGMQNGSTNALSSSPYDVPINIIQNGAGILSLPAVNTYSGTTVISNGTLNLAGSIGTNTVTVAGGLLIGGGSIAGAVTVQPGGSIEAGTTNVIGTLNLAGGLTLSGNTIVKINGDTHAGDLFSGQSSVTYGGTLTVTNLSGTLAAGDSFTLFSPGTSASNFSGIIGSPGAGLHYSFTNGVLSVAEGSAMADNPTNITVSVNGNTLNLSWPADHQGWILQAQTNGVDIGLSNNWFDVAGSDSATNATITINPANPAVFYRLRHP